MVVQVHGSQFIQSCPDRTLVQQAQAKRSLAMCLFSDKKLGHVHPLLAYVRVYG